MLDVVSPWTDTIPGAGYVVEHFEHVGRKVLEIVSKVFDASY
jgi:hypothetical protein